MSHDHHHHDAHSHDAHGHTHEQLHGPGLFRERGTMRPRNFSERAFTVGIGGPVGSGKTALLLALCRALRNEWRLGVVTNDIFTREDAEFLERNEALPKNQIAPWRPEGARMPRFVRTSRRISMRFPRSCTT